MLWGHTFVFNNIPSETFNLYCSGIDSSGSDSTMGSSSVQTFTQALYKRPRQYLLGVQLSNVLNFPMVFTTPNELDAPTAEAVQRWLFGQRKYGQLQIMQPDIDDAYFNCILNNPQIIREGNIIRGFSCDVECDSPWAWTYDRTANYDFTTSTGTVSPMMLNSSSNLSLVDYVNFENYSDDIGYLYPLVKVTMNNFGGDFSIVNMSENDREFYFTNLSANEVITIDCDLQTIDSSTGLLRLGNFNKKWLRFISGMNNMGVYGNIAKLEFHYRFARKIGG